MCSILDWAASGFREAPSSMKLRPSALCPQHIRGAAGPCSWLRFQKEPGLALGQQDTGTPLQGDLEKHPTPCTVAALGSFLLGSSIGAWAGRTVLTWWNAAGR